MNVLVCGDAMTDLYWYAGVSRISPEAPVPVAQIQAVQLREGGAANVARNLEAMWQKPRELYSPSYTEENAIVKLRVVARGQQLLRCDFDYDQEPISLEAFQPAVAGGNLVVFSDYGKGALAEVQELIACAKAAGATVFIDPKGHKYERYKGADLIKPNLNEMRDLVGPWDSEKDLEYKIVHLMETLGGPAILLTRGAEGMTLYDADKTSYPTEAREVYDVSGAGDTAMAALAAAFARGHPLKAAVKYANKAAGLACGHFGTTVIQGKEIFDEQATNA